MSGVPEPTLSICLTCRDGREGARGDVRGGARLARAVRALRSGPGPAAHLRGLRCTSRCKHPCAVALTAPGAFSDVFGDPDPEDPAHARAIPGLIARCRAAPEGLPPREARPEPLRAAIPGRLPPRGSRSDLVVPLPLPSEVPS